MTLIIGLPNAGKTTYSKQFAKAISLDDVRGNGRDRRAKLAEMVRQDNELCIEGVYAKAKERKPLIEACSGRKVCIWLNTPIEVCIDRETHGRKRPTKMIEWAAADFEPPTYSEGWDEIIIIGDNNGESY